MASPEKMIRMLLDEIRQDTAPLATIIQNQEILILQNKQLLELLEDTRLTIVNDQES
ncbi:hypothetical protein [Pelosinus sp. IPA-1]|uniref:hypothetical protein n=1 Tax=Pelosinus sp. IPA-1 TaxID=3029569 RepID=UPI00243616F2|nr:hypothetical protein [Pelosinus sp. IPA-1]GMA98624.1 hypothetical protein PIPA1_14240 [Pelosinus sp. IPA-1]